MSVRTASQQVKDMTEAWTLIDALMGGTAAMRKAGGRYLPRWPSETVQSHNNRIQTATLFPAYSRTVAVLTGKPFSKPITVDEDVPPRIVEWLQNVDLQNRNIDVFAAEVCATGLAYGLCGILVDCPIATGVRTVADEKAAGIRPYCVLNKPGSILGWKSTQTSGARTLTQLRLLETVEVPGSDPWETKTIEQVRVLEPGKWQLYRRSETSDILAETWDLYDEGTTSLNEIPFVPVYGLRKEFMVGAPPMLELGYSNVEHWQSKSDQQTILHVARVPIMFAKGLQGVPIVVGADSLIQSDSEQADLKYVEHSGKAIDAGRMSILDLEDRMRQAGAELLVIKPGNITEMATIADNEMGMCDLQRIMQAVEDALDQALEFMAKWVGEKVGGHLSIYRDFGAATLAEASMQLLFAMNMAGKLSNETTLQEAKRRGVLSPDIDVEEEIVAAKADAPPPAPVADSVQART